MHQLNQAILRMCYSIQTVQELIQEMNENLNLAYQQVELHTDSSKIMTFPGSDGLYQYKGPCLV